jgi:hypothetical protein
MCVCVWTQVYPALAVEGRIVATHVVPPTLGGHAVANAPTKVRPYT